MTNNENFWFTYAVKDGFGVCKYNVRAEGLPSRKITIFDVKTNVAVGELKRKHTLTGAITENYPYRFRIDKNGIRQKEVESCGLITGKGLVHRIVLEPDGWKIDKRRLFGCDYVIDTDNNPVMKFLIGQGEVSFELLGTENELKAIAFIIIMDIVNRLSAPWG